MAKMIFTGFSFFLILSVPAFSVDPAEILSGMSAAWSRVNDYTAIFYKQERVNGTVLPEEKIQLKFKKPFKIYMKWLPPGPHEGRESLYVRGENGGKVIGHEGGILGFITLKMEPAGSIAMKGNRHPITDAGIGRLIEILGKDIKHGRERGELKLKLLGEDEVYGREAWHILKETPAEGYYAPKMEIWVDKELNLPIKIKIFGPGDEFLESYGYSDLKVNIGLKDEEFTKGYKDYHF
jgi:outer membrane lipoprotein-sorting protein